MAEQFPTLYGLPKDLDGPRLAPDEIVRMAEEIRKAHHTHLDDARIAYVVKPGQATGFVSLGKATAVSAVLNLLCEQDFIIALNWPAWWQLTDEHRIALLDHELTHCDEKIDKNGERCGWTIRIHDVEDFAQVIDRRGLWSSGLQDVAPAVVRGYRQHDLFDPAASDEEAEEAIPPTAADAPTCPRCGRPVDATVTLTFEGRSAQLVCKQCLSQAVREERAVAAGS